MAPSTKILHYTKRGIMAKETKEEFKARIRRYNLLHGLIDKPNVSTNEKTENTEKKIQR